MRIAKVYIEHPVASLNYPFDYYVTPSTNIVSGVRVDVEFNGRIICGYVEDIVNEDITIEGYEEKFGYKINPILNVIDSEPILNDELCKLAHFLSNITISPIIACYQSILPPALKPTSGHKTKEKYLKAIRVIKYDLDGLTPRQQEVLEKLNSKEHLLKDISSKGIIDKLTKLGLVEIYDKEIYRSPFDFTGIKKVNGPKLNDEQINAINEVKNSNDSTFLLEGVTGSGKTEVYINLAIETIKKGRQVLILVPEISLTPAMIRRFSERIDGGIAVLHSGLSLGEKYDEYRRIVRNECQVVIGARSAIFAPLDNIGLIVVDEEHSESYKQDTVPSYQVLDVVKERQNYHKCKVVLGSATPSLESKARAIKGVYHQLYLTKRINNQPLPKVDVVDMTIEARKGNFGLFSERLSTEIQNCLDRNEQIILLLNRRGYAISMSCSKCGHIFKCPSCGVALHYHRDDDKLKCHYCGYEEDHPTSCPSCGNKYLRSSGIGTQKVEEIITSTFKGAKVIRMDVDSVRKKGGHQKILDAFENQEYNILLGTQMIAKGLDFPNVTLVGVLNADTSLYCGDFRCNERTFQLLTQVVGRSGRGALKGQAIIQTFNSSSYAIALAAKQDYKTFFNTEMQFRRQREYPPYRYLSTIMFIGTDQDKVLTYADKIKDYIKKENKDESLSIFGPAMPYIPKFNNKYRFRIMLKYKDIDKIMTLLHEIEHLSIKDKVTVHFDTTPYQEN